VPTPIEIAIESIAEGYYGVLSRLCECRRLRREYSADLELASVADAVIKALADGTPLSAGPVKIEVKRGLLKKSIRAELWGKEISPDELLTRISQARSRAAWLQADCSDQAVLEPIYASNDRDAIDFAAKNLEEMARVCDGEEPSLALSGLPEYIAEGIKRGIKKFIEKKT
jgi:hypothetical protein